MAAKKKTPSPIPALRKSGLWPIRHTRAYYRRVALAGPMSLKIAVLLAIADRVS